MLGAPPLIDIDIEVNRKYDMSIQILGAQFRCSRSSAQISKVAK